MFVRIKAVDQNRPNSRGKTTTVLGFPQFQIAMNPGLLTLEISVSEVEDIGTGERSMFTEPKEILRSATVTFYDGEIDRIWEVLSEEALPRLAEPILLKLMQHCIDQLIEMQKVRASANGATQEP